MQLRFPQCKKVAGATCHAAKLLLWLNALLWISAEYIQMINHILDSRDKRTVVEKEFQERPRKHDSHAYAQQYFTLLRAGHMRQTK